jgi:hypothetical protein
MYLQGGLDALSPDVWAGQHPETIRQYRQEEREERATAKAMRLAQRLGLPERLVQE